MFTRLTRKGVAPLAAIICTGLPAGFLALQVGCASNPDSYKNPAPTISKFLVSKADNFTAATTTTTIEISSGQSAWFKANFAVKDGSAILTPGNIALQSNVATEVPNITTGGVYTLTVTSGDGQKATATTTVNVTSAPTISSYSNEDATYYVGVQIPANTPTVAGATPITYSVPTETPLPAGLSLNTSTGAITGTPQVTTTRTPYTITATNAVGSDTHTIHIATLGTPISFSVSPSSIALGAGATLSWDATSVAGLFSNVTITANPTDASLPTTFGLSGTANVSPAVTTTYTLSATPTLAGAPAVTKTADLTVGAAPVNFTSFTVSPSMPNMGSNATLSWTYTGTPLDLTLDGINVLGSFSSVVTPVRRQAYTLAGSNLVGGDSRTINVPARGFDLLAGVPASQGTYDGKGTSIRFTSPAALAADAAGNVYWVDTYGHTVRMLTPDGQAKTIAGTPGLVGITGTTLKNPRGIAVTSDGNTLYVGDSGNAVIKKIVKDVASPTGYTMSLLAGVTGSASGVDGPQGTATFGSPSGLALDPTEQYLLVADYGRNTVRQVSVADGSTITYAGNSQGAGAPVSGSADVTNASLAGATFYRVNGIAFNKAGTAFYVSDGGNYKIRMVTWTAGATSTPTGSTYTVAGTGTSGIADGALGTGTLSVAYSMAVAANEDVYIADYTNGLIRKMVVAGNAGTLSTIAGFTKDISLDGVGTAANFNKPQGMLLKNSNTLLVSEVGSAGCIRSIDLGTGAVTTPYGIYRNTGSVNGTGSAATFNAPVAVTTDAQNNVYVSDTKNHLIRKITPAGVTTPIAGTGTAGAVNGNGTSASFSSPQGIAVDSTGNLYVADTGNKKVRLIDPTGNVSDIATLAVAPTGIAVDPTKAGRIYVVTVGASIYPIDGTTVGTAITATPAFNFPATFAGIIVDASGDLIVADRLNHSIRKVTSPLGTPTVATIAGIMGTAGILDGALGTNTLNAPNGLGMDADGNIFFSENGGLAVGRPAIRMISASNGAVSTLVASANLTPTSTQTPGTAPGVLPASVTAPQGLAVNTQGDILVTTLDAVMQLTAPAGK